jgi:hypothetical protein
MKFQSRFALVAAALVAALALATTAHAGDPLKCKKEIAKDFAKYVQAKTKALQKCREKIVKNQILGPCPDAVAAPKIAKAETKMRLGIGKQCGGSLKSCTDGDAVALGDIGWDIGTCPNFENGTCNNAITNCDGISDCLACVGEAAVDQAIGLYYDGLVVGEFGSGGVVNKCQIAIGKNAAKFLVAKNKALQKCEDGVLKATVVGPCPDAVKAQPKIDKAQTKMQAGICKACGGADKLCDGINDLDAATIGFASSCPDVTVPGGSACLGTVTSLQDIRDCVTCVNEYKADCLDPIAVPAVKPTYPTECNPAPLATPRPCAATSTAVATPCPTSTPGIVCPSQVVTEANGGGVDLDTGWSGQSHDAHAPSNSRLTLGISGCTNPDASTCGVCTTLGPQPNAGGTVYDNRRCLLDTSVECTVDGDCGGVFRQCINSSTCIAGTNPGAVCTVASQCPGGTCTPLSCTSDLDCPGGSCAVSQCSFFFGSPLPLSAGGVTVCVTNQITGAVTGTVDIEAGSTATTIQLLSRVHVGGLDQAKPCPNCDTLRCHGGANNGTLCTVASECPGGTCGLSCTSGPRDELACTVNGTSALFGNVSFDCPPSPGTNVATFPITLAYTTGTQSVTLTADNPPCRAAGYSGSKCFCDTCNNLAGTACSVNADCVAVGATVCGGRRCLGGANAGSPCILISECPGGGCGVPGTATQPNECSDTICSPVMTCVGGCNDFLSCTGAFKCEGGTNVDTLCTVDSECPGGTCSEQCPGGACVTGNEGTCAAGPFEKFCAIETFRGCANNADCMRPGDSCTLEKFRDCFLDNGVLGGSVTVSGVTYPSCGGSGSGTVGAFFCIPPTASGSVNNSSGLPGLGRVTLPYTATFN